MSFADLNLSKRIRRCQEFSGPYRITDGKKFKLKELGLHNEQVCSDQLAFSVSTE